MELSLADLLPLMEPQYNLREVCKQLLLLEDHLFHPRKRCLDCIRKHLLTAEALAEETITLDVDGTYRGVTDQLADRIRGLWRDVQDVGEGDFEQIAQATREIRKALVEVCFHARVANWLDEPSPAGEFEPHPDGVCPYRVACKAAGIDITTLGVVARVATRHLQGTYFNPGDTILYGKYKNKKGLVVRLFRDERGVPSVEVEPVPKGRKQNKTMGLFKVWHADPEKRAAMRMAGPLIQFPGGREPPRPKHVETIGGERYALSSDGGPLGDQLEDVLQGHEGEGAKVIDVPAFRKPEPYRFLWAYDTERGEVAMWRVTDGNEKVWGRADAFGSKIVQLERKGELNRVTTAEMQVIDREMRRRESDHLRALEQWVEDHKDDYQRLVDQIAQEVFDKQIRPTLERRLNEVDRGVIPIGFKVNDRIVEHESPETQVRVHVLSEETAKYTIDMIEDEIRRRGIDPNAAGHDIQAAQWAYHDVIQEAWQRYKRAAVRVADRWASMFEAPPALIATFLDWAIPTYAGNALFHTERRLETVRNATKPLKEGLAEIERIRSTWKAEVEALANSAPGTPSQKVWSVPWPAAGATVGSYSVGVQHVGANVYVLDHSPKRVTFRKNRYPRRIEEIEYYINDVFNQAKRRLENTLRTFEGTTRTEQEDVMLVDTALLVRELRKHTTTAKEYRTSSSTRLPITTESLRGWKYKNILPPDPEVGRLITVKGWDQLKVGLFFQPHATRGGGWIESKRELQVDVPVFAGRVIPQTVAEFHSALDTIRLVARHEFQHVGQDLLRDLTGGTEERGLPSPALRDPKYDPSGILKGLSPGHPLRERLREEHALRDVEFYTRLADEITHFTTLARKIPLDRRREAVAVWTGGQKGRIDKSEFGVGISGSTFFATLKRENVGKWRKAVGEFVAGIESEGVRIPAVRKVAGTWGYEPWAGDRPNDDFFSTIGELDLVPAFAKLREQFLELDVAGDPYHRIFSGWAWVGTVYLVSEALKGVPEDIAQMALNFLEAMPSDPAFGAFRGDWKHPEDFDEALRLYRADLARTIGDARDGVVLLMADGVQYLRQVNRVATIYLRERGEPSVARVAAKYKNKKKVETEDGDERTVYEYSERQVQNRNRDKAERIEKLRKSMGELRKQVKKDLDAEDPEKRLTALAIALIDETYERVGNEESAGEGHFGVTGWQVKHISFTNGTAKLKYVGKSGVKQEKEVADPKVVKALKAAIEGKDKDEEILCEGDDCRITSKEVNAYLEPFDVTAKDLRGLHANEEMQTALKEARREGGKLPEDKKEMEAQLKEEFAEALEVAAEAVGHEASTLKSQYLVPGLEDAYLKDGTVLDALDKKEARGKTAAYDQLRHCPHCQGILHDGPRFHEVCDDCNYGLKLQDETERLPGSEVWTPIFEGDPRLAVWRKRQADQRAYMAKHWGIKVAGAFSEYAGRKIERDHDEATRLAAAEGLSLEEWQVKAAERIRSWLLRRATKSRQEKEDEEADRLIRREPEKKPPRTDLRRRRVEDQDVADDPDDEQDQQDTSHNWKDIGAAWQALASRIAKAKPNKPKNVKPLDALAPKPKEKPKHEPGDVWQTEKGTWSGKSKDGKVQSGFGSQEAAKAWVATGKSPPKEKPPESPGGQGPTEVPAEPAGTGKPPEAPPEGEAKPEGKGKGKGKGKPAETPAEAPKPEPEVEEVLEPEVVAEARNKALGLDENALMDFGLADLPDQIETLLGKKVKIKEGDILAVAKQLSADLSKVAPDVARHLDSSVAFQGASDWGSGRTQETPEQAKARKVKVEIALKAKAKEDHAAYAKENPNTELTADDFYGRLKERVEGWRADIAVTPEGKVVEKGTEELTDEEKAAKTKQEKEEMDRLEKDKKSESIEKFVGDASTMVKTLLDVDRDGKPELPEEFQKKLTARVDKMSPAERKEFSDAMKAAVAEFPEDPPMGDEAVEAGREALGANFHKMAPADAGKALAQALYADRVTFNPLMLGGRKVSDDTDPATGEEAEATATRRTERGVAAKRYYAGMEAEERAAGIAKCDEALRDLHPDSPKAQEIQGIKNGIALAAIIAGEEPAGVEVSEQFTTLANAMSRLGEEEKLLGTVGDFTTPESQTIIRKALETMTDSEMSEHVKGSSLEPLAEALLARDEEGNFKLSPEDRKEFRKMIEDALVEDIALLDPLVSDYFKANGKKNTPKARAKYIAEHRKPANQQVAMAIAEVADAPPGDRASTEALKKQLQQGGTDSRNGVIQALEEGHETTPETDNVAVAKAVREEGNTEAMKARRVKKDKKPKAPPPPSPKKTKERAVGEGGEGETREETESEKREKAKKKEKAREKEKDVRKQKQKTRRKHKKGSIEELLEGYDFTPWPEIQTPI